MKLGIKPGMVLKNMLLTQTDCGIFTFSLANENPANSFAHHFDLPEMLTKKGLATYKKVGERHYMLWEAADKTKTWFEWDGLSLKMLEADPDK